MLNRQLPKLVEGRRIKLTTFRGVAVSWRPQRWENWAVSCLGLTWLTDVGRVDLRRHTSVHARRWPSSPP